jgi:hypothetical protein
LAAAIGINEPSCWDLLVHESELTCALSLRQFVRLGSVLGVSPFSLLPVQSPPHTRRSLPDLAAAIRDFCAARGVSIALFSDSAGWDVGPFLRSPDFALDNWCLDTLRHVCHALGLHWPDYLPDATQVA